jgi:hypothetical protein
MKIIPSKYLLFLSSILFFFSCDTSTSVDSKDKIVGEWIWLQSSGGWSGTPISPQTVGYSVKLVFEEDGGYKEYRNDSLTIESSYTIERKPYGSSNKERDFLIVKKYYEERLIEFQDSNKLKLIDTCIDCYVHNYFKLSFF